MRTPNTECILCKKPLYRRPSDMAKARYASCMECRSEAQKVVGITAEQHAALALGRQPGDNGRTGYVHREESKRKASESHIAYWSANPDKAIERGAKVRGELHYLWKGGVIRLNTSIRQMHENRKWMDAVKERDGYRCQECGRAEELEAHHRKPLAELIDEFGIKNRDDARANAHILWDLDNGKTLCRECHYAEHGRAYSEAA